MSATTAGVIGRGEVAFPSPAALALPAAAALATHGIGAAVAGGLGFVDHGDAAVVPGPPLLRALTGPVDGEWLPLRALSLGLDGALFGSASAAAFHVHSALLHALNATLVAVLALRLGSGRAAAVLAGAIFAVHPATTEAVAWVAARGEVLGFALAAVGALLLFPRGHVGSTRSGRVLAGAGVMGAAVLADPGVAAVPLLLALAVAAAEGRDGWRAAAPRLLLAALVVAPLALVAGFVAATPAGPAGGETIPDVARAVARGAAILIAPVGLTAHPPPGGSSVDAAVLGGLALVVVGTAGAVRVLRGGGGPSVAAAAGVVAALLVGGAAAMPRGGTERDVYLAAAPAAALAAAGASRLRGGAGRWVPAAAVLALAVLSAVRVGAWRDGESLARAAVAADPANPAARLRLGEAVVRRAGAASGEERTALLREAAAAFEAAAEASAGARRAEGLRRSGLALLDAGDGEGALRALERAEAGAPAGDPGPLDVARARALRTLDRRAEARAVLEKAVGRADPPAEAWLELGTLRLGDGDLTGAKEAFRRAVATDRSPVAARLALADLALAEGDFRAALAEATRAIEDSDGGVAALIRGAEIASILGRPAQAEEWYRRAAAAPANVAERHRAREGWAAALAARSRAALLNGDAAGAVRAAREAVRVDADGAGPRFALGEALRAAGDAEGAVAAFGEALERGGGDAARDARAAVHLARAVERRDGGDPEGARRAVEMALAEGPKSLHLGGDRPRLDVGFDRVPPAGHARDPARDALLDGLLALVNGERGAAIAALSTAVGAARGDPAPPTAGPGGTLEAALLLRSRARSLMAEADGAVADLEEMLRRVPDDARAWLHLGQALTVRAAQRCADGDATGGRRDDGEALRALDRARALDGSLVEAAIATAELHFVAGRPVDALRELNAVLAADPDRVEAHLVLGDLMKAQFVASGDVSCLADAETAFRRALAVRPSTARALAGLAETALLDRRQRDALTYVLRALTLDPSLPRARTLAAVLFVQAGRARLESRDAAGALDAAARAAALGGETAGVCLLRAEAHRLSGDWAGAHREVERARAVAPRDPEVRDGVATHYRDVGYALLLRGRRQEAEEAFRRALAADPPSVDLTQVRMILDRGAPATAGGRAPADAAGDALDRLVVTAREWFERGSAALRAGGGAEAVEAFRKCCDLYETSHARFALGVALEAVGDRDGARDAYRRAVDLDPGMASAWLNLGSLAYRRRDWKEAAEGYRAYVAYVDAGGEDRAQAADRVRALLRRLESGVAEAGAEEEVER